MNLPKNYGQLFVYILLLVSSAGTAAGNVKASKFYASLSQPSACIHVFAPEAPSRFGQEQIEQSFVEYVLQPTEKHRNILFQKTEFLVLLAIGDFLPSLNEQDVSDFLQDARLIWLQELENLKSLQDAQVSENLDKNQIPILLGNKLLNLIAALESHESLQPDNARKFVPWDVFRDRATDATNPEVRMIRTHFFYSLIVLARQNIETSRDLLHDPVRVRLIFADIWYEMLSADKIGSDTAQLATSYHITKTRVQIIYANLIRRLRFIISRLAQSDPGTAALLRPSTHAIKIGPPPL